MTLWPPPEGKDLGRVSGDNPLALLDQNGWGRASSDDSLAPLQGKGQGRVSSDDPLALFDDPRAIPKWEGQGRTVTTPLLFLKGKTKGRQSVITL